jgi:hypothetical protein
VSRVIEQQAATAVYYFHIRNYVTVRCHIVTESYAGKVRYGYHVHRSFRYPRIALV